MKMVSFEDVIRDYKLIKIDTQVRPQCEGEMNVYE